jgi:hypothetical protein
MKKIIPHSDRVGMGVTAPVLMTGVYSRNPVQPIVVSGAVIVNVNEPAAVGVPEITPPVVFSRRKD